MQKVMRYALSSKFVLVENTEASGHLYEFPDVAKGRVRNRRPVGGRRRRNLDVRGRLCEKQALA